MSYNHVIYREDPDALAKLTEKLEACQKSQGRMKSLNAYYRKHGTCKGYEDMSDEKATQIDARIKGNYSWEQCPFPSYALSNNNAEIRRLEKRVEELSRDREIGFIGWTFDDGEAIVNDDLCRLQLLFDNKPAPEEIAVLKSNGFHWSPREGVWQRQLNQNCIYACDRIDFIRPDDGSKPSALQPKAERTDREDSAR